MKLQTNIFDHFSNAERRFAQFGPRFSAFVETLEFFQEPRCPVPRVKIKKTDDPLHFVVEYRTVSVGFRMLCELSEASVASARVVCVIEKPSFTAEKRILGSFTFNAQGLADFKVSGDADPIDIQYMAPEIVLHFLHLALERGVA